MRRDRQLRDKLCSDHLLAVDVQGDGNCFYRAVSYLTTGNEFSLPAIRQSIADIIEQRGNILGGLINSSRDNFRNYICSLRTPGDYTYVGDETAIATAELYGRDVRIYSALAPTQVYKPNGKPTNDQPLILAFCEPAHYMALVSDCNKSLNNVKPASTASSSSVTSSDADASSQQGNL